MPWNSPGQVKLSDIKENIIDDLWSDKGHKPQDDKYDLKRNVVKTNIIEHAKDKFELCRQQLSWSQYTASS